MTEYADHHVLVRNFGPGGTRQHDVIEVITNVAGFDINGGGFVPLGGSA